MNRLVIEKILAEGTWSSWRKAYVLSMLERVEDFAAVGKEGLSQVLHQKLMNYLDKYSQKTSFIKETKALPKIEYSSWGKEFLERELQFLNKSVEKNKSFIPRFEVKSFLRRLDEIQRNSDEEISHATLELRELREDVLNRYRRSAKAMSGQEQSYFVKKAKAEEDLEVHSHYNDAATLQKLLATLSETDPIWVGDFLGFYGQLLTTAEQLSIISGEKKKK